jgi:hypothetical protein
MVTPLFYYQLALLPFIWLFVMLLLGWPRRSAAPCTMHAHEAHAQACDRAHNIVNAITCGVRWIRMTTS